MFKLLLLISMILFQVFSTQVFINFSNMNVKGMRNPERGPTSGYPMEFMTEVHLARIPNISLIFRYYYLPKPASLVLPAAFITKMKNEFSYMRNAGKKVIIRFAYSTTGDAPFAIVNANIIQLSRVLEENKDVIFAIQAGFIGKWGEWHSSNNNLNKQQVLDLILKYFPKNIQIQLRYARDIMQMYGTLPVTQTEALQSNTIKSRLGLHNDCFLYGDADRGTFNRRNFVNETSFFKTQSLYTVVGGERCGDGEPPGPERAKCPNALSEFAAYHWTYLKFFSTIINEQWKHFIDGGCVDEVVDRLGYQLYIREASLSHKVYNILGSDSLDYSFKIQNKGFAAPVYNRPVRLVLVSGSETHVIALGDFGVTNLRTWLPGTESFIKGSISKAQLSAKLPLTSLVGKTFSLNLVLPDSSLTLKDAAYSLGFVNVGVYNSTTGLNKLFLDLKFSTSNTLEVNEENLLEED